MVSVVQGFVPLRKRIWGYQGSNVSLLQTAAAGARVMPYRGPLVINPNWTFEDTDQGDLVGIQAPSMRRWDNTSSPSGPVAFDDLPWLLTPSVHGGVTATGGGAAKTWAFQIDSDTPSATPLGYITEQWGDDVLTDWHQGIGGIIEELTVTGDVGGGPLQASFKMRFAKALGTGYTDYQESGTVPNTALSIDDTPAWVYLDDCELFIDDTAGGIGVTKISDALETLRLVVRNIIDIKSPANGSNTRFTAQAFARARMEIELALTFAKTTQTVGENSEADDWLQTAATKRFVELRFTSPEIITGSTPYSWVVRIPLFYTTREDGENGNNTRVTLTGTAKTDSTLTYPIRSVVVCATASLA
jgi:hypothetical protein